MTNLIDTYCGSGLFCLSGASLFGSCTGIEVNEAAVAEASANAELNSITNCKFVSSSAEMIFTDPSVASYNRDSCCVICDPPRKGCSLEYLHQVIDYKPVRLIYMSCDPSSLARDTKILRDSGVFELTEVQPFDLFPMTRHIEACAVFERRGVA